MGIGVVVIYTCIWANMTIFFKCGYRHNAFCVFDNAITQYLTPPHYDSKSKMYLVEKILILILFFYERIEFHLLSKD